MPMNYINSNLLKDEQLIYGTRPHWIIFSSTAWTIVASIYLMFFAPITISFNVYGPISVRMAISLAFLAASVYLFLSSYIYYVTSEYGITNKRVLIKTGWIRRESLELILDKVEGVLVDQTIPGRLFDYGTITVIGTGGTKDSFPYIPNPLYFRKMVQEQITLFEDRFRTPIH